MKSIVFISGKGGTGKSTIVASLSLLVQNKIIADCDVDAPDLHLLLGGERLKEEAFYGKKQAVIDASVCVSCGMCAEACRFDAIMEDIRIDAVKCEGCGACSLVCPQNAISLVDVRTGAVYADSTELGMFCHALLDIGGEGSGRLVTEVRKNAHEFSDGEAWALIDGSPGIGCPVIASVTGADAVVAVCEPTKSGLSDLKRVLAVAEHFLIPAFVCINKYDLNTGITSEIEQYCESNGTAVIGRIPFEPAVVKALQSFETPVEAGIGSVVCEIGRLWDELKARLDARKKSGECGK
jgi:MinD superfamily P-loop ATPase